MAKAFNKNATYGSARSDEESKVIIYRGANQSQITKLFKISYLTFTEKVIKAGVKPVGEEHGFPIYDIAEVAQYIVKPKFDIEAYIKRMNHADLPKEVTKAFWEGLRSRQEYQKTAGSLWPVEKIVEEVGELFKMIKMTTLLMLDGVERNTELTDRQKSIIQGFTHGMLNDLMKRITDKFKVPDDVKLQEETDSEDI